MRAPCRRQPFHNCSEPCPDANFQLDCMKSDRVPYHLANCTKESGGKSKLCAYYFNKPFNCCQGCCETNCQNLFEDDESDLKMCGDLERLNDSCERSHSHWF